MGSYIILLLKKIKIIQYYLYQRVLVLIYYVPTVQQTGFSISVRSILNYLIGF